MLPLEYHINKDDILNKSDNRSLYNDSLYLLNDNKPIAFLSFYDNSDYERTLIELLNERNIKSIKLLPNLWIIFNGNQYIKNVMYVFSLFSKNSIHDELSQHIQHISKYTKYGINAYDYINKIIVGYSIDEIKKYMYQQYKNNDYTDKSIFDIANDNKTDNNDDNDIIFFDCIFNFVLIECNKAIHYLFNESKIFNNFIKENSEKIQIVPIFRFKIQVPKIEKVRVINLLEPPKVNNNNNNWFFNRKKGRRKNKAKHKNFFEHLNYSKYDGYMSQNSYGGY